MLTTVSTGTYVTLRATGQSNRSSFLVLESEDGKATVDRVEVNYDGSVTLTYLGAHATTDDAIAAANNFADTEREMPLSAGMVGF